MMTTGAEQKVTAVEATILHATSRAYGWPTALNPRDADIDYC